jgi:hypothetical protein
MATIAIEVPLPGFDIGRTPAAPEEDLTLLVCATCGAVVHGDDEPDWAATWNLYDCWHAGAIGSRP